MVNKDTHITHHNQYVTITNLKPSKHCNYTVGLSWCGWMEVSSKQQLEKGTWHLSSWDGQTQQVGINIPKILNPPSDLCGCDAGVNSLDHVPHPLWLRSRLLRHLLQWSSHDSRYQGRSPFPTSCQALIASAQILVVIPFWFGSC